jgi:hypothetical protein
MSTRHGGVSAFDRLRARYDEDACRCAACGYEDTDGGWRVETSGATVRYTHVCPSCAAERTLTYDVGGP